MEVAQNLTAQGQATRPSQPIRAIQAVRVVQNPIS